jgi:NitT/TauT family transport system substrate-binding protein
MMEALAEGEVDVAPGMLTVPVLQAIASGARLRVVGALGVLANDACPFNAFVARSELVESGALRSRDGLQQLRWDADVQLPHGYWVDEALRRFDLTIDDLRIVALSEPEAVDAIVGGTVDVTIVSEPSLSRILASGAGSIWRGTNEVAAGFPLSLLMYGPTLLDQRPEVGERFAAAMLAAMRQYAEGSTPRNLEIVARATNLDEELLGEACWPVSPSDGQADPDSLQGYQTWAVAQGFTDRLLPGDELIDRRFMDAAVRLAAPPR